MNFAKNSDEVTRDWWQFSFQRSPLWLEQGSDKEGMASQFSAAHLAVGIPCSHTKFAGK